LRKKKQVAQEHSFESQHHNMKCFVIVCAILLGLLACAHANESEEWDVIGEASSASQLQFIIAIKQVLFLLLNHTNSSTSEYHFYTIFISKKP
jgi:hypothetical protein